MIGRVLRAPLTRLLIVALVPAVVLGVFVAALAAADDGSARIPAALVNSDRLVQQKGADGKTTTVAAGRLVVSGLTKPADPSSGASIDWTLTNADRASQMLADGDVYAIVTIPKDFSKSIATVSSSTPKQADIRIRTDDAHGTLVSQIGGVVGDTIAKTVGGQITTNVVSGLYSGYASVRTSLLKAADGASGLGSGAGSLANGLGKAANGGDQLATGASGLGSGARQLGTGAGSIGDGARRLGDGADSLASGLRKAADGAQSAAGGASKLASGVDDYTDGVSTYTKGVNRFLDGVAPAFSSDAADGQAKLASGSSAIADGIRQVTEDPTLSARDKAALTALAGQLDTVSAGQSKLADGAKQLAAAGAAIPQLESGGTKLANGGSSLDSGASSLAKGLKQLPGGIRSAASGADRLASGADQLGTGADKLATGANQLGSGADQLSTGAAQLSDGVRRSASGAQQLADGADRLGSGLSSGAKQVPNLTAAQRTQAGKVVANPVDASATRSNELSGPGQIVSTLILPVGLWIGAAALVLLFGAVSRRLLSTGVGTGRLVGGALLRGAAVAVAQAVLVVGLLAATVRPAWSTLPALGLIALVAGVGFLAIHQLLQTIFGRAGTVLSIVLLGVQLVAVGGIYPIELVAAPFQAISPWLPLTAAVNATTAVLTGSSFGAVASGLALLVLEGVIAFALTTAITARRRTSTALFAATPALP